MKRRLLLLVLAFYCAGISAQERGSQGSQVKEVNTYMAYLRASEVSARNLNSNSSRLETLLKEVQPALYYLSGEVRTYGESPTSLFTNSSSSREVAAVTGSKQSIEIVNFNLDQSSDIINPLDLSSFSSFPNLKYIYILSTVETSAAFISSLVRNNDARFGVFYKIDKGA